MTPVLSVENLRTWFHTRAGTVKAVDDLSFSINPGETVAIVGESGCGKSMTALSIMRLVAPPGRIESGSVRLGETELLRLPMQQMRKMRGNDVAMIFQEPMTSLNPVYTIGRQIMEAVQFHEHLSARAARSRALEMLTLLGIPDPAARLDSYPHQLSGGMRQRAMIGMALACRPALLIADEPTTALDVTVQAQILDLLQRLQRELGMAMIFITHNLGVAGEIADQVLVMYAGQCGESGPRQAVFEAPRYPYTMGLMRAVPRLGADRAAGPLATIAGTVPDLAHLPPGCSFHPRCLYFLPGLCDAQPPELEVCGPDHLARCLRWRDVASL